MSDRILREDRGGLCTLTLNRPDKVNALDTEAFETLDAHLDALERDTGRIGCVILRGAGRGFCAGADLTAMAKAPAQDQARYPGNAPDHTERLARFGRK